MNISGILVTTDLAHVSGVQAALAAIPGLSLGPTDAGRGRIVVLQEAADVAAETTGFMRIRALPHVLNADLVCHWFGDEDEGSLAPQEASSVALDVTPALMQPGFAHRSPS